MNTDLTIPDFLRLSAEVRRQTWIGRPLTVPTATPGTTAAVPALAADMASEIADRKRRKARGRVARMLALKAERAQFAALPKSQRRWNQRLCRWELLAAAPLTALRVRNTMRPGRQLELFKV